MNGYKIKFNGIDRLYAEYSWRLTRRAKQVWSSGNVLQGQYLDKFERELGKKYIATNMMCSGKMGTGCVCADKKQFNFLSKRGNNA